MSADSPPPRTLRVLVVDDSEAVRAVVTQRLVEHGRFDVVGEACDGQGAVASAAREQPDAIVLDLEMPILGGLDALPLLHDACPRAAITVYSSIPGDEARDTAFARGAQAYLMKDAGIDGLIQTLVRLADAKGRA